MPTSSGADSTAAATACASSTTAPTTANMVALVRGGRRRVRLDQMAVVSGRLHRRDQPVGADANTGGHAGALGGQVHLRRDHARHPLESPLHAVYAGGASHACYVDVQRDSGTGVRGCLCFDGDGVHRALPDNPTWMANGASHYGKVKGRA